jgi:hypothetical protein
MESPSLGYTQRLISSAFDKWLKKRGLDQSCGNNFLFNRFERVSKNKANAKPPLTQEQKREKWRLAWRKRREKEPKERSNPPSHQQSEEIYIAKQKSEEDRQIYLQKRRMQQIKRREKMSDEEKIILKHKRAERHIKIRSSETPKQRWDRLEKGRQYRIKQKEQNEAAKV